MLFSKKFQINGRFPMVDHPKSIDTSLIDHLLSLSYEERLDAHEAARQLVQDLLQAGQDFYARQSKRTTAETSRS